MRESIPRQADKKSRVPEEEEQKGVWGSQGGDRGLREEGLGVSTPGSKAGGAGDLDSWI